MNIDVDTGVYHRRFYARRLRHPDQPMIIGPIHGGLTEAFDRDGPGDPLRRRAMW
jgi:hypothetical protein